MSFSGNLEYLSIVDVIQLLHSTRKTGSLVVNGAKGTISVVFNDGYITGASHYNRGNRTGEILVESGVITSEERDRALAFQAAAGTERKPFIATLLEHGLVDKNEAYRALETLIELAIVEILTWKTGIFSLEPHNAYVCDEFRYFPEKLSEEINLPAEHLLMDALRIYDEKMRDGLLEDEQPGQSTEPLQLEANPNALSADDLGLGDLDSIKRRIPGVFEAIKDRSTSSALPDGSFAELLKRNTSRLRTITSLPEGAAILLETVAAQFARAVTLVVWEKELVAERSYGLNGAPCGVTSPVLGFKLTCAADSQFAQTLANGRLYYGPAPSDTTLELLYKQIEPPRDPALFLLPLTVNSRIVALIYADFGAGSSHEIATELLTNCAEHTGLAIEAALRHAAQP